MKTITTCLRLALPIFFMLTFAPEANAQLLKKLGKRAEKAAERAVERRVDKEATEKTDQALDSILEPGKDGKQNKKPVPQKEAPQEKGSDTSNSSPVGGGGQTMDSGNVAKSIEVYSKFDFVPGDKQLFFDDFGNDFVGDFPAKWNTNGSGEVVTVGDSSQKWLELLTGHNISYIPDVAKLPEEYTIEFDVLITGVDSKTSSTAGLQIQLSDDPSFKTGNNYVHATIPFGQYAIFGIRMKNVINNKDGGINSVVKADIRDAVLNQPHIAIAVNKQRFRLWVNEEKYIDIPRIVVQGAVISTLKFHLANFQDGKERLFISNVKVAEGGLDLRRKLISEGKISTNGILFDSGSANMKAQSMGIILQISQVLQQEKTMALKIVGHTDADGNDANNLNLSKKRADAVKNTLVSVYNIDADRLITEGKGETEPVGDNGTLDGKALNRRVEFIKQ